MRPICLTWRLSTYCGVTAWSENCSPIELNKRSDTWGHCLMARYPHEPYVPRIWQLRHSLRAYDAAYVALAEALQSPLITRDSRLASAHGHRAKIELIN